MATDIDPMFEELYGGERSGEGLIHGTSVGRSRWCSSWVAYGAVRGEVLDPGTGPGYHAIHYASQGYSTTGVDGSPSAIERAKRNAERAGVHVDFRVGDATVLDGFEGRFDTVVDSAFYHVFLDDQQAQTRYAQALPPRHQARRATVHVRVRRHNVNGLQFDGCLPTNFERVFGSSGWYVDYVGTSHMWASSGPKLWRSWPTP